MDNEESTVAPTKNMWMVYLVAVVAIVLLVVFVVLIVTFKNRGVLFAVKPSPEMAFSGRQQTGDQQFHATLACDNFHELVCDTIEYQKQIFAEDGHEHVHVQDEDIYASIHAIITNPQYYKLSMYKIKKFLQVCLNKDLMDTIGLQSLKTVLDSLGEWPILEGPSTFDDRKTLKMVGAITRAIGTNGLIDVVVTPNVMDPVKETFEIMIAPVYNLMYRTHLLHEVPTVQENLDSHVNFIVEVVRTLKPMRLDVKVIRQEAKKIIDLHKRLMKINNDQMETSARITELTVSELLEDYRHLDWLDFFNATFFNLRNVSVDSVVLLVNVAGIHSIVDIFNEGLQTRRTLVNYAFWNLVKTLLPHVNDNLNQIWSKYMLTMGQKSSRQAVCIKAIMSCFPYGVAQMYTDVLLPPNILPVLKYVTNNLKNQLVTQILLTNWFTNGVRKDLMQKTNNLTIFIGAPQWALKQKNVKNFYLPLAVTHNHLENFITALKFRTSRVLYRVRQRFWSLKQPWIVHSPVTTEIVYLPTENMLLIPAEAIRLSRFKHVGLSKAGFFGRVATTIATELSHVIDTTGIRFDSRGGWSLVQNSLFPGHAQFAHCIRKQYGAYCPLAWWNVCIDGSATVNENIADNIGLHLAYSTYLSMDANATVWDKMDFFFSFTSVACPVESVEEIIETLHLRHTSTRELRVNGPLKNMPEFSEIFDCSPQSLMNPDTERCLIM